jgi:hypothetical protein
MPRPKVAEICLPARVREERRKTDAGISAKVQLKSGTAERQVQVWCIRWSKKQAICQIFYRTSKRLLFFFLIVPATDHPPAKHA